VVFYRRETKSGASNGLQSICFDVRGAAARPCGEQKLPADREDVSDSEKHNLTIRFGFSGQVRSAISPEPKAAFSKNISHSQPAESDGTGAPGFYEEETMSTKTSDTVSHTN
jgi:hypothetical protein